jgi:ParB family chromosome partitioning protein
MDRIKLLIDQLVINPDINPRHASDDGVSDLVAQIRANGFSDAIWVRPLSDGFRQRAAAMVSSFDQMERHVFEVIDGSRRLRALRQLLAAGELDSPLIECDLIEADDARARELALAANFARSPLSPADEARAFYALKLGGMGEDQIAAHFAVPLPRVRQRIAIGQLPDQIIDALRTGAISIDTAQAFTLTNSREHQLKIFESSDRLSKWDVKQALTKKTVSSRDPRALFVGLDAYREAGGKVIEDLFSDEAFLDNEKHLQKLFDEKLKATVKALKDEGWAFVKVLTESIRHQKYDHHEVKPKGRREHTPAEIAEIAAIKKRQAEISDQLADLDAKAEDMGTYDAEIEREQDRLTAESDEITARMDELTAKPFTPKQIEALGVLITVPGNGRHEKVEILRGRMPAEKEKKAEASKRLKKDPDADRHQDNEPAPARDAGFTEAVEVELVKVAREATKLAMLRDKPAIAARLGLAARVQNWLIELHDSRIYDQPPFAIIENSRPGLASLAGGGTYDELIRELFKPFTAIKGDGLFAGILATLETMTPEQITAIEAAMAAHWFQIDVLRNVDVQVVIKAIDPDMSAEGFKIDAEFLGRLSRDQIALITVEINPDEPVAKGKKPEMVAAALPLIEKSGWLPAQLRTPSYAGPGSEAWEASRQAPAEATEQDQAA